MIANNSLGASDPVQIDSFTYPLPPEPMLLQVEDVSNVTVLIYLDLLSTHSLLTISLEVSVIPVQLLVHCIINEGY